MFNLPYRAAVRDLVRPKFKGQQTLVSKYVPLYPWSVEREYVRFEFELMDVYKSLVIKYLPKIDQYLTFLNVRRDDDEEEDNRQLSLTEIFFLMEQELDHKMLMFDFRKKLEKLANTTRKLSIQEWKRSIRKTLGLNILEDYYSGDFYADTIPKWIEENVNRIVRIPKEMLGDMKTIIQKGFFEGRTINSIVQDIQEKYEITKRHARLIARDQTGKLYGQLAKQQQQDGGVNEYIWKGVMDNRERESHVNREGIRYRWGELGENHEPGMEINCRCIALPVFDIDNLDLPVSPKQDKVDLEEMMFYG